MKAAAWVVLVALLWRNPAILTGLFTQAGNSIARRANEVWSPVTIDGALWVSLALFAFMSTSLSSDEAYKYIPPTALFWLKFTVGSLAASCTALKAFRSTTYGDSQRQKQGLTPTTSGPTTTVSDPTKTKDTP